MSNAKRLLEAFEGSSLAHGRTTVGRVGRNGKTDAKYTVLREPLTETVMQHHIDGKQGVNSIPINADNQCKFGVLDIDIYDLDLGELAINTYDGKLFIKKKGGKRKSGSLWLFFNLHNYSYPVLPHNLQYKMDMGDRVGCLKFGNEIDSY